MSSIRHRYKQFRGGYRQFQTDRPLRYATRMIVILTIPVVLLGALVMRLFDRNEYDTFGEALWFTLQTVTTVGYGDTTPTSAAGKVVASVVMLTATGFLTIVTARVTTRFIQAERIRIERSNAAAMSSEAGPLAQLDSTLSTLAERLDQVELTLAERLDQIDAKLAASDPASEKFRDPF